MDAPSTRPIAPEVTPVDSRKLLRHRTLIKLGGIFVLSLCLLVPLGLLVPVLGERAALRDTAVDEIHRDWGRAQNVIGPLLVLPLRSGQRAFVLPDELRVNGQLVPEGRSRGIYSTVVFTASLELTGTFRRPEAAELGLAAEEILWDQAFLALAASDLRGVANEVALQWGGTAHVMKPGTQLPRWDSGLHVLVQFSAASVPFAVKLSVRGSDGVRVAPLGLRNVVAMRSSWTIPRFAGAYLPTARDVSDDGFDASWTVSYYARSYPQHGHGDPAAYAIEASLFGVDLLPGIDSYRSVDRAIRYGVLFVVLAFMSFFLFEVVTRVRIHPFQYAMVGLALGVFFLLLLALSEVVAFAVAYATSAAATVGLVASYMVPVLRTGRRTLVAVVSLLASFAVLYVVLQAEDYALLAGSVVVFIALAIAMRLSRGIDWYADDRPVTESPKVSADADAELGAHR
jgi:inner membrane protein